jgi:transcriptional regulator with XRE-family HTH domain
LARLEPYEEIARQVMRLRMDDHLSQEALARRVGTTKSAISRLESGHHAPTVTTLHKVALAFDRRLVISFDVPAASTSRRRVAVAER